MTETTKYTKVAMALHWVMALALFGMLVSGLVMTKDFLEPSEKFQLYQAHKSMGVILLLAFFLRLGWRFFKKPPAMPGSFKGWELTAAKAGHIGLYIWMIALPISGWVMVSASIFGLPTIVFDLFEWPHVPFIEANAELDNLMKEIHEYLAYSFIALIGVHIAAVLKHWILDKENIMKRMLPLLALLVIFTIPSVQAADYAIDYDQSYVSFAGQHAGDDFDGVFEEWSAEITFDPVDLENASIKAVFQTESAKTGNKMYDGTLPQADWFDVKNYPKAVFTSETITVNEDEGFNVAGSLTIRDISKSMSFDFTLEDLGDKMHGHAEFSINRLDFAIGQKSDAKAEWVSEQMKMKIHIIAKPVK